MWTLPGPLSEKLNFKFVINSKADFSGDQKHKKLHFDTKCHIFGSTWESNNFKTCFWIIIKFSEITASQIYFRLKDISGCENFVSKIRGFIKLKKKSCGMFFQCLILNISSIKELLHKPSEIQWNITETLPGKLKIIFFGLYPTRYYPLKSLKRKKLLFWGYFGGQGTNVEFNGFL